MTELWITRDKNNSLYIFTKKPIKIEDGSFQDPRYPTVKPQPLICSIFPEVTFENSPKHVILEFKTNPKKAILKYIEDYENVDSER